MTTISYALTASTEVEELPRLITALESAIRPDDEIVLQLDKENTSAELSSLVKADFPSVKVVNFPLNNHFAEFKNNLKSKCSKDYIFQIDADETPHASLIELLPEILETYPEVGLFHLPRINTVEGITRSHLEKWKWTMNERGWINWPDYQPRIFKNLPDISWKLPVHETVTNYKTASFFPEAEEYCLYHPKTISRQEAQNDFYASLNNDA